MDVPLDFTKRMKSLESSNICSKYSTDDGDSNGGVERCPLDRQEIKDAVAEAIETSVKGVLEGICSAQGELGSRMGAIWTLLAQLEQRFDESLPPAAARSFVEKSALTKSPSMKSDASIEIMAIHMANEARAAAERHVAGERNPTSAIRDDVSFHSSASSRSTAVSCSMYDFETYKTNELFAAMGLFIRSYANKDRSPPGTSPRQLVRVAPKPPVHVGAFCSEAPSRADSRSLSKDHKLSSPGASSGSIYEASTETSLNNISESHERRTETSLNHIFETEKRSSSGHGARAMSPRLSVVPTMDSLRTEQDEKLVAIADREPVAVGPEPEATSPAGSLWRVPHLVLHFFRVVPWPDREAPRCFGIGMMLVLLIVFLHCLVTSIFESHCLYIHLSTACYAFGGLIGAISLRLQHIQCLLGPVQKPLVSYAHNENFFQEWQNTSLWRLGVIAVLWLCMVLTRIAASIDVNCQGGYCIWPWNFLSYMVASGFLAALAYLQIHVCCGLELAIDTFCNNVHEELNVEQGIAEWTVLQALLRRAAHTVDVCFLSMNTTVLATLLLTGIEVLRSKEKIIAEADPNGDYTLAAALRYLSAFSQMALLLYTVFRAAAVTEKCSRVPALINSWMFTGKHLDDGRQYIVQHITSSNAGFYVKGVRLTALMALKLMYVFGIISFTLVSNSILS